MNSIDRYVFRSGLNTFGLILVGLTAMIWLTQILRQFDLVTGQGQTVVAFLSITSLIIPTLMLILAPIALLIAVVAALTKLNNDSELVVMSASGLSPRRLFRPFIFLAAVVAFLVANIATWLSPMLQREMNERLNKVRADLVANVVRSGTFASIEPGLTFHIREKRSDSQFSGVLIDDFRDPNERATILAEQGTVLQQNRSTYLVMSDGWVQRRRSGDQSPALVHFERYAFDLSPYTASSRVTYGLRERYLWELIWPDPEDRLLKTSPNQYKVELNDRLTAPLYPFAFVIVSFVMMCNPRTTRQNRMLATVVVTVAAFSIRLAGFASLAVGQSKPAALYALYPLLFGVVALGVYAVYSGRGLDFESRIDLSVLRDRILARLPRLALR